MYSLVLTALLSLCCGGCGDEPTGRNGMEDSATPLTLRIEKAPKSPGYWVRLRLTNTSREPLVLNLRNLVGEATDASLPTALPEEHLYELEFVVKDHTGA